MQIAENVPLTYADIDREKKRQQIAFRRFMHGLSGGKPIALYLGCALFHLRQHLSARMTAGMTWNNYGVFWTVDHIIPLRLFNVFNPADLTLAWNYRNLMPLQKRDNLHKEGDLRFSLLILQRHDDGSEITQKLIQKAIEEISVMDKYLQRPVKSIAKAS